MSFLKIIKNNAAFAALTLTSSLYAASFKADLNSVSTIVNYQVTTTKQIQQDEIQSSFRIEKSNLKSEDVQAEINTATQTALDLTKKFPDVKATTGRYFVYKDEQKDQWKGIQVIHLDSISQNQISQLAGLFQKSGFIIENYSYIISEKKRTNIDNDMRVDLIQKATQIAADVIAKNLNKKFLRFAQIDFSSQNYYPVALRSMATANVNKNISNNNPSAQAGLSDVQMSASISAVFGE